MIMEVSAARRRRRLWKALHRPAFRRVDSPSATSAL